MITFQSGYLLVGPATQSFTGSECMEPNRMSASFKPTTLVGAIALAMSLSTVTSASEATNSKKSVNATLDPLVITATLTEDHIEDIPARISVIDQKILKQSAITSLPELLKREAAANIVQSGGYGQQSSIFLRGTNSTQTLVLQDGVRLNTASAGSASLAYLDTSNIKQIEILKGPASVLYGTDAIGGVVQLITQTPERTGAFVTGQYGENNTYKVIIGADLFEDGFYGQIRGQNLATDGTPVTNAKNAEDAGFHQKGFSTKVGVKKENYAVSLDYGQNQGKSEYNNYSNNIISQNFKNEMINLKGQVSLNEQVELDARLSQFKDDLDQNQSSDFIHSKTQEAEVHAKWQFTPAQNLIFGIAHQKIDGDILSDGVGYNESVNSTGYFVQHQYDQNGIHTQLGLRVEDNQKYGTNTVAQAAIRYQILPLTSIYTNIGSAFRAPNLNELYSSWGGNPNLDPEKSTSYEIGLDQKLNYGFNTGLSLYQTDVKDLITYSSNLNQNINKAKFKGVESYIHWENDQFFAKLAYNYVKSTNETTHADLTRRPRQSITFTTGLQNEIYGISASLSAKSNSKDIADYPSTTPTTTPGYTSIDLNAYWNINPNVKVFTDIQNVGDVKYKTSYNGNGVYYINGGRLASVGVTLKY